MPVLNSIFIDIKATFGKFISGESLKAKFLRGSAWLGAGSIAEQLVRFVRNIVLARILAPDAFGTMAIVLSAGSVVDSLTEIGVREAVIQNPRGEEYHYLNAAWWLALGRGLSLYAVMYLLSPAIAKFYGNPILGSLLRVTLLSIVFNSVLSPGIYRALRQMKFHKWAAISHGGGICGVLITVVLSFYLRNVWALVIGYAAEGFARALLSYFICPHLPTLRLDRNAFRELTHFSRGMFGLSFLNLVFARADIFVLAKLYPASALGLYAMAIYLAQTPANFLMNMLGQTLLPTFSNIREDNERINRILIQITSTLALVGIPALAFVFYCGRSILTLSYGKLYSDASLVFFVAAFVALLNIVNAQITTVFYADGRPALHRRSVGIMAILMIALIYQFAKYFGVMGGQLACAVSLVVGYLFQVARLRGLTGISLPRYAKPFAVGVLTSFAAIVIALLGRPFAFSTKPIVNIILGILGCAISYLLAFRYLLRNSDKLA